MVGVTKIAPRICLYFPGRWWLGLAGGGQGHTVLDVRVPSSSMVPLVFSHKDRLGVGRTGGECGIGERLDGTEYRVIGCGRWGNGWIR